MGSVDSDHISGYESFFIDYLVSARLFRVDLFSPINLLQSELCVVVDNSDSSIQEAKAEAR